MDERRPHERSHLFTVRLWSESLGENHFEWRGQVRHVPSGRTCAFRDWSALEAFLQEAALLGHGIADDQEQP